MPRGLDKDIVYVLVLSLGFSNRPQLRPRLNAGMRYVVECSLIICNEIKMWHVDHEMPNKQGFVSAPTPSP